VRLRYYMIAVGKDRGVELVARNQSAAPRAHLVLAEPEIPPLPTPAVAHAGQSTRVVGWPPGSRTQLLLPYQDSPFTGWVAASGRGGIRTHGGRTLSCFQGKRNQPLCDPTVIYCAESGGHDPLGREALIRFRGDSGTPARFTLHERRMEIPTPSALRHPFAFRAKPARLSGSSSMAEGGLFESQQPYGVASVSSGARSPVRFTFHACPTRDSNSEPLPPEGSASTKLG
jgi:hypothetical protein